MSMPNPSQFIAMDLEMIIAMMAKFSTEWEDGALPTKQQIGMSFGTDVGVTYEFRKQVGQTAAFLAGSMTDIQGILATSRDKILEAVNELADRDASMADEAAIINEALSSLPSSSAKGAAVASDTSSTTSFS